MRIRLGIPLDLSELTSTTFFPLPTGIATDSGEIEAGDLFLALRGERTDGARYAHEAVLRGAVAVMSEVSIPYCPCIRVNSITDVLARLAGKYLDSVNPKTVAVTGSVGKSTVIAYLKTVLSSKFRVHAPHGNFNTDIGLPLTILEMPPDSEILLLEMGARHAGDIHRLSLLSRPEIAVITNIGCSHLEAFGSKNAILLAKTEIVDGMPLNGKLLLNIDDPMLYEYAKGCDKNIMTLSATDQNADFTLPTDFQSAGTATRYASLFASAIGEMLGIEKNDIQALLSQCVAPPMRQEKIEHNEILYLMDAYNASPESMLAAFELLSSYSALGKRVYALLGDMRELGRKSRSFHKMIGEKFARINAEKLFCYGEEARAIGISAEEAGMLADRIQYYTQGEEQLLIRSIQQELTAGDVILLKASRAMHLEQVLLGLLN